MEIGKQIFVSGLVQGVFFRDNTRRKADALQLKGGVRNCRDGRVEVLVVGEEAAVDALIKWLKIGPKHAKVSTIEVIDLALNHLPEMPRDNFEIWPTR